MRISANFSGAMFFNIIFTILIAALLLYPPHPADATGETEVSIAMGASPIKKDAPSARDAAVAQALLMALEKTALQILPLDRVTETFDTMGPLLTDHRDDFIQDYKVLKESNDGKTYRVLVQATIVSARLKQALGTGAAAADQGENMPAVLFMMAEQQAGMPSVNGWWQGGESTLQPDAAAGAMKQALTESGIKFIDEKTLPLTLLGDLQLTAEMTDAQIVETGKRAKADVVVAGTAIAVEAPNRMGETMPTYKGTVTARLILVETGETLPPTINTQTALHSNNVAGSRQALIAAGKQAGLDLAPKILAKWKERSGTGGDIFINLTGSDILSYLPEFRTALKRTPGVSRHQTLEMGSDKAILKVTFDGTPQALADALVLESFDSFGINIFEITGNQLQVQLSPQ